MVFDDMTQYILKAASEASVIFVLRVEDTTLKTETACRWAPCLRIYHNTLVKNDLTIFSLTWLFLICFRSCLETEQKNEYWRQFVDKELLLSTFH
jgi:hypothetical protein